MTAIEQQYVLERAAGAAEACLAMGLPQHVRACILDGLDAAGVRLALAGTSASAPSPSPPPAAPAPSPPASKQPDWPARLQAAADAWGGLHEKPG